MPPGREDRATTTEGATSRWSPGVAQWPEVTFALEDCRHLTRQLEWDLLGAGHPGGAGADPVDGRCPPGRATAGQVRPDRRRSGRPGRVAASRPAGGRVRRADPGGQADRGSPPGPGRRAWTRTQNRPSRGLRRYRVITKLSDQLTSSTARLVSELLARCAQLTKQINALEAELRKLVTRLAPRVLAVPGCGVLGAAMILGETAGAHRFRSKDTYARFTGTAPIPVWSGNTDGKVRLNRGGNRTINTALHMIAVTQARGVCADGRTLVVADRPRPQRGRPAPARA